MKSHYDAVSHINQFLKQFCEQPLNLRAEVNINVTIQMCILHMVGLDASLLRYFKHQNGLPDPKGCPITMSSSTAGLRRVW